MATKKSAAKADLPGVVVQATSPINHDGETYAEGDTLPEMPADQAQALVDAGCAVLVPVAAA